MGEKIIYFDNAATKKTEGICCRAVADVLRNNWGNPSSLHTYGDKAHAMLKEDRETVAKFINTNPENIIFTSGGCESNSLALLGIIRKYPNVTLITTRTEHKSIMSLAEDYFDVRYIDCQEWTGTIYMKHLEELLQDVTHNNHIPLVSVHYANAEIGTIQDIKTITSLVHKYQGIMHTDATQMMAQEKIDVKDLGVDLLSFSGQKLGAPKGIGVLYKSSKIDLRPIIYGSQEFEYRGGTENTAYIHALAELIRESESNEKVLYFKNRDVRDYFLKQLNKKGVNFILLGHPKDRLDNHASICFLECNGKLVHGESMVILLSYWGICVSTGSACNSHSSTPSYVAQAIKVPEKYQHSILRFTFNNSNTRKEVDTAIDYIIKAIEKITKD